MLLRKLRPHQVEAVRKASPYPGFAFWMEQRTGKTLTALALVDKRKPAFTLIVTVKKGKKVWEREIQTSLRNDWDGSIEIIHYEELHKFRAHYRAMFRRLYAQGTPTFIIADESHRLKRRGSRDSRTMRYLGKLATYRLALSGTPLSPRSNIKRSKRKAPKLEVTAGLQDAWAQYDFIDPSIFRSAEEFEETYLKKGGFRGLKVVGYKNKKKFYRLFHKYSYRKLLREVQERKTLVRRVRKFFELTPATRRVYDPLERGMFTYVRGGKVTIPTMMAKTVKLQQVTGGFLIDKGRETIHRVGREKLKTLKKLLMDIFSQGHGEKVVICANFIHEIKDIQELVSRMGFSYQVISGKTSFDGKFEVDVTIIQIQSGVAIDLSEARSFIFYSMGQKYIDYEQARFRILSYTKRQADFYYLLARRTVDELVYEAQTKKKDLVTLVIDHYRRIAK